MDIKINKMHIPKRVNQTEIGIEPEGIILHYIGNPGTTAAQNANYFHSVQSQVSVHYIVDDIEIIEIIPPNKKSFGTSSKYYNEHYIQIEMCHSDPSGRINPATLDNVIWLCKKLIHDYDIIDIIRHYDVTGKRCPLWYVDEGRWKELKMKIMGDEETQEPEREDSSLVHWAQPYFDSLLERGITINEKRFDDPVTRGEMFTLLSRIVDSFKV